MFTVKLRTLTPVWTGDIDQKGERLQPNGIMGSLRWWTEITLRGIGFQACDPTSNDKCPQNDKDKDKRCYCASCLIFGATGMRRAFRLDVSGGRALFSGRALNIKPSGRSTGWYLGSGIVGEITLSITPLDPDFHVNLVLTPLVLASRWGGIGARTQHGYGVVDIEGDVPNFEPSTYWEHVENFRQLKLQMLSSRKIGYRSENNSTLPNLKEMFFAKVLFEAGDDWWKGVNAFVPILQDRENRESLHNWINSGSVPIAPIMKNWLRYGNGSELWKIDNDRNLNQKIENWLFGTIKRICKSCYGKVREDNRNPRKYWCVSCRISLKADETYERNASKIYISSAYRIVNNLWEFRIWGWIPTGDCLPADFSRDEFLNNLYKSLSEKDFSIIIPWTNPELFGAKTRNYTLKVWREYNSPRDTVKQNESNVNEYFWSLLKGDD